MLTREQLESYDAIVVAFSGGKDSAACVLDLLDRGAPKDRLELWHHDVDGREGSTMMDWPCTKDYCRAFAEAFGLKIYYSWKVGGFEREMLRDGTLTAPTAFETPDGLRFIGGTRGKHGTRRKFPQLSGDLSVRWCSAYLKIDVGAAAIRNQERFNGKRLLFVTGERAEEDKSKAGTGRAGYAAFEPHRSDGRKGKKRRHVDQWRPVHAWSEAKVWETLERHLINPHPAYRCGWNRVSCAPCIFGNADQWASLRAVNPAQFDQIAGYETQLGTTIKTEGKGAKLRKLSVLQSADRGTAYRMSEADRAAATSTTFAEAIILQPGEWKLPAGAFGEGCGPT